MATQRQRDVDAEFERGGAPTLDFADCSSRVLRAGLGFTMLKYGTNAANGIQGDPPSPNGPPPPRGENRGLFLLVCQPAAGHALGACDGAKCQRVDSDCDPIGDEHSGIDSPHGPGRRIRNHPADTFSVVSRREEAHARQSMTRAGITTHGRGLAINRLRQPRH